MDIVLYARKSVERENSISCETQLQYCKAALKPDERNAEIIEIVDNGFSGGNVNRNGFQKMMKLIEYGNVRKVVVYKLDRISRSTADFVNILQIFKKYNVEFVSSQEAFDTASPYGEMIVKILMVFAEFERTSTINRVTQAYAHRSEMSFYMGGRRPYGFKLIPAVINNIATKKLSPIPEEAEQIRYIFTAYAQENISLRMLLEMLDKNNNQSLSGNWTTAKLSSILKNPIYVKADCEIYNYFEKRNVRITTNCRQFTGKYGAQLYGKTKHQRDNPDWSDMKLVLLSHNGLVNSETWLKCQKKLEHNKQIHKSLSNNTSWLAGKVICEKCGFTMSVIKSKPNKNGEIRRYFNCTGKSHNTKCTGTEVTMYAENLEELVSRCIAEKLCNFNNTPAPTVIDSPEINEINLRIIEIEHSEQQLLETLVSNKLNEELIEIANVKASMLKNEKKSLCKRIDELKKMLLKEITYSNPSRLWEKADYSQKKAVTRSLIEKILVSGNGNLRILWYI